MLSVNWDTFRHHTNPVGTEWKWQMDPAEDIVKGALENHRSMINQFKGTVSLRRMFSSLLKV